MTTNRRGSTELSAVSAILADELRAYNDRDASTIRLRLVAPDQVLRHWHELVAAWDALAWNLQQDGPMNDRGDYHVRAEEPAVIRIQRTVRAVTSALRRAMGIEETRTETLRASA